MPLKVRSPSLRNDRPTGQAAKTRHSRAHIRFLLIPPRSSARTGALFLLLLAVSASFPRGATQSAPTVTSASVHATTVTLSLSESLASQSTVVASDFSITLGAAAHTVNTATISGADVILTLSEAIPDAQCTASDISASYSAAASSLIGVGGGTVAAFSGHSVDNTTDAAPVVTSISTDTEGDYVYIHFCEPVDDVSYQWSDFSAFTLRANGASVDINDMIRHADTPSRIDLPLSGDGIAEGHPVTLAYDQTQGSEDYPLQDADQGMLHVASWTARTVTNNVDSPPTLTSISALWDQISLTFSEPLDEDSVPDGSAFTILGVNDPPSVSAVAISGSTVVLTTDNVVLSRHSPTYTLDYVQPSASPLQQVDGEQQVSDFYNQLFTSDTPDTNPSLSSASVNASTLTLTFDQPLKNVAPPIAFSISGVQDTTVSGVSFSDMVVTLTLSTPIDADDAITVSYVQPASPPRIESRNNRDAASFSNQAVTNTTAAPAPTLSTATISADGTVLTLTFTVSLDDSASGTPATSTFSLDGTTGGISDVSVSGTSVTLTLNPTADVGETVTVSYAPPTDQTSARLKSSAHGKAVAAFSAASVTNNADGKPRPVSATIEADTINITFTRPLDNNTVPASSAFTLAGAATSATTVAIATNTLTITISPSITHEDVVTLSYQQPATTPLTRAGRTETVDGFAALALTNLTEDPTPLFRSAATSADGATLIVTMSHPLLDTSAGLPAGSTLSIGGTSSPAVTVVSITNNTITLTVSPATDFGETITLTYTPPATASDPSLRSPNGRWRTPAWTAQAVTNNTDGIPRLTSATVIDDTLTLTFDRTLDASPAARPPTTQFTLSGTSATVTSVDVSHATVTLTISAAAAWDDTLTITYLANDQVKLKRAGLTLTVAAFAALPVTNNTVRPLIDSAIAVDDLLTLTFTEQLDTTTIPAAAAFSLGAENPSISQVRVSTTKVDLTLSASLREGVALTITYTEPDSSPLTLADGRTVGDFSRAVDNQTDTAPMLLTAAADGATLALTFDQSLDPSATIPTASLSIAAASDITVSTITIDAAVVSLALDRALLESEAASLSYDKPNTGGIADTGGLRTESFVTAIDNQTDTPPVPTSGTVEADTITIILDQAIEANPRFDEEDGYPTEHFILTGTDAAITFVAVSDTGPGKFGKIVITLSKSVTEGDLISIRYAPQSGSIRIFEDDDDPQRAEINNYVLTNLTGVPPAIATAAVDGTTLTLIFDQTLDADSVPPSTAFSLSNMAPTIDTVAISGSTLTLTVPTTVIEGADYTISYTAPATNKLQGPSTDHDDVVPDFTQALTNTTDYAPYVTSIQSNTDGNRATVTFDQRIDPSGSIDGAWFSFAPTIDIDAVIIDPNNERQIIIELDSDATFTEGVDYTLSYAAPTSAGLRDETGNLVASFTTSLTNQADSAPTIVSATIRHKLLTIVFDQPLDEDYVPPRDCPSAEEEIGRPFCDEQPELAWFVVERVADRTVWRGFQSIVIDGSTVVITMLERVAPADALAMQYTPQSAGGERWNLRDITGNQVEGTDALDIVNITPAIATGASVDRSAPTHVFVDFDDALTEAESVDPEGFSVTVDGVAAEIDQVSAAETILDIQVTAEVAECTEAAVAYHEADQPLLDGRSRTVDGFSLGADNYIIPEWKVQCVHSDFGALIFTVTDDAPQISPDADWTVTIDDEDARDATAEALDTGFKLAPATSVCLGDTAQADFELAGVTTPFLPSRPLSKAAPCVSSAVLDSGVLTVTFDQTLDSTDQAPKVDEFQLKGEEITSIGDLDGPTITMQLADDSRIGNNVPFTYSGSSLMGGGLTVGGFKIPIVDLTPRKPDLPKPPPPEVDPPEFIHGFGSRNLIILQFDAPLLVRPVAASRFLVTAPRLDTDVDRIVISGSSITLWLDESLPDNLEFVFVVYLAPQRAGLQGETGGRLDTSVFQVRNFTETPPTVASAVADSDTLTIHFDQEIVENADASPAFVVTAGRRTIPIESMTWTDTSVELSLTERVTSVDVVRLVYEPADGLAVVDLSGLSLAALEMSVENKTKRASSFSARVEDARLRADGGSTTFARELAQEFSSNRGIDNALLSGQGWTTIVFGDLHIKIDASRLPDGESRVHVSLLDEHIRLLPLLESLPESCWDGQDESQVTVARIDAASQVRLLTDDPIAVRIVSGVDPFARSLWCRLDLVSGEWSTMHSGATVISPALLIVRNQHAPYARQRPRFVW